MRMVINMAHLLSGLWSAAFRCAAAYFIVLLIELARLNRPFYFADRLGNFDLPRAGFCTIEGCSAAPNAHLLVENFQALLGTLVA